MNINTCLRADKEVAFRWMDRELVRRERIRLIRLGIITPAYRTPPQMMVKTLVPDGTAGEGKWIPEIKYA